MWTTREYKQNFYWTVFVIEWLILRSNRSRHSPDAAFFVAEEKWLEGFFQIILLFIFPHLGFGSPHLSGRFLSWARYYKHTQNNKLQLASGLRGTGEAFLLPIQQARVQIPAQPEIFLSENFSKFVDRFENEPRYLVLCNGFHKCSQQWRSDLSTTTNYSKLVP